MIAIAGGKGGSGKTTTTLGIAAALATATGQARVVDLDTDMPDVHHLLEIDRTPTVAELPRRSAASCWQHPQRFPNMMVATAPQNGQEPPYRRIQSMLKAKSGHTLLDCPCGAGPDVAQSLAIADQTVLVSDATEASIQDTIKTNAMAQAVGTPVAAIAILGDDTTAAAIRQVGTRQSVYQIPLVAGDPLTDARTQRAYRQVTTSIQRLH